MRSRGLANPSNRPSVRAARPLGVVGVLSVVGVLAVLGVLKNVCGVYVISHTIALWPIWREDVPVTLLLIPFHL